MVSPAPEPDVAGTHPVRERLAEKQIKRVALIDDSFDAPTCADLEYNELAHFWAALDVDSEEVQAALAKFLSQVPASEDDISDEGVAALYKSRDELGLLQAAFDDCLRPPLERKHGGLDPIVAWLSEELRLEVRTYGTTETITDQADVVFLDYFLGVTHNSSSVASAQKALGQLLALYPAGVPKPLVVLMSSFADVTSVSDDFRARTGIIGGMFYFVPKSDLTDHIKFLLNLDMLSAGLPAGHQLQQFIDDVEANVESVAGEFITGIKRLNLNDYVYIQRLSLQADGHPLGDYLLWLYSAFFAELLFERALGEKQRALDSLVFADWIPSQASPSKQLTRMYHAALFDMSVGPLESHPRWRGRNGDVSAAAPLMSAVGDVEQVEQNGLNTEEAAGEAIGVGTAVPVGKQEDALARDPGELPYLHLGDVFIDAQATKLLMVANPACDLAFAPDDKRLPDPRRSIVLMPGTLESLDVTGGDEGMRTELFEYQERRYRIVWEPKLVEAHAHGEIAAKFEREGLTRVARLRVPFSLEVQQYFAANFTRVGVPVKPPFFRNLAVATYQKSGEGRFSHVAIVDGDAEAFVIDREKGGPMGVLTLGLIRSLQRQIHDIATQPLLAAVPGEANPEKTRRERANKRIANAQQYRDDYGCWRKLSEPFELPKKGDVAAIGGSPIGVGIEIDLNTKWSSDAMIIVNLIPVIPEELTAREPLPSDNPPTRT